MTLREKLVNSLYRPTVTFQTSFVEELTKATVRSISNLIKCYGYSVKSEEREQRSIDNIVDLLKQFDDEKAVKVVKYLTSVQLPTLLGDTLPERPEWLSEEATLFGGEYGRYVNRLLATRYETVPRWSPSRRQISLATGILQLKRLMPALPASLKTKALEGCRERLTRVKKTSDVLLHQIRRTTNELFPTGWDTGKVPSFSVTNKSCYESTRKQGGAQAYMFSEEFRLPSVFEDDEDDQGSDTTVKSLSDYVSQLTRRPKFLKRSKTEPGTTSLAMKELHSMDEFGDSVYRHVNYSGERAYLRKALETYPDELQAQMEIVEDPLKARVITKNNWQCTILKPLQKMIHSRLRSHECFQLIGTPITNEIMKKIQLFSGAKYVSGDYEAATDNLHADCTEIAIETILGNMTGYLARMEGFVDLASKSLTQLNIYSEETGWFKQTNGQLMGSLLSFPILCIINFAVWRHVTEQTFGRHCDGLGSGGRFDHVLINGDDIAFAANPDQYARWWENVKLVGLMPSAGKNYYSEDMIMINSIPFVPRGMEEGGWEFKEVHWCNQGLLQTPVSNPEEGEESQVEMLGKMHDDFVRGCEDKKQASGIFIGAHSDLLKTTFRNLFGPLRLGGLGAHPVPGTKGDEAEGYDVRQLFVAKLLKEKVITLPKTSMTSSYSAYAESYVKKRFPNVIEESLELLDIAPDGYRWEDVTERVGDVRANVLSMTSWLGPLLISRKVSNDHRYLRRLMKTVQAKKIEFLPYEEYLSMPSETGLFHLVSECMKDERN